MKERLMSPVPAPMAWKGKDLAGTRSWIFELSQEALRDIDAALSGVRARGLKPEAITKADFPLPCLERDLERLLDEIENGRGFVLVRGLPMRKYDVEHAAAAFCGISAHFGHFISQNARGDLITNVRDEGLTAGETNVRGYMTRGAQKFHTDNADIVALLCLRKAKSGGYSSVASSMASYNEFLEKHPRYLDRLYEGFRYDLHGEERPGFPSVTEHRIPVFSWHDGRLSCRYVYSAIVRAQRKTGVPLGDDDMRLLELFNSIAERDDMRLEMDLLPGDMQFLNNHSVLHSRTEYEDHDDPALKRHMMRLWITPDQPRPLDPVFADRYGTGDRLGVPPARVGPDVSGQGACGDPLPAG